ncbi:MAG: molybdopterin dinucleotide-binding protein [Candidatus Bathyarchaeota archaeon B26-2]|nr:MAG: molybdopterin dinucleotide-binding protein [Candidatus Bathyarchaeota archaeon B26-2]
MDTLKVSLLTGRTVNQGKWKELGKLSREYMESVAVCEMDPQDMRRVGLREGRNVKVTTRFGSVVVKAVKSKRGPHPGKVFIPYGPWSNIVVDPETDGTGMPSLKGVEATVEPTEEPIMSLEKILMRCYGGRSLGGEERTDA